MGVTLRGPGAPQSARRVSLSLSLSLSPPSEPVDLPVCVSGCEPVCLCHSVCPTAGVTESPCVRGSVCVSARVRLTVLVCVSVPQCVCVYLSLRHTGCRRLSVQCHNVFATATGSGSLGVCLPQCLPVQLIVSAAGGRRRGEGSLPLAVSVCDRPGLSNLNFPPKLFISVPSKFFYTVYWLKTHFADPVLFDFYLVTTTNLVVHGHTTQSLRL